MAESEQNREDVTCSICVEVCREPVVLPCQHSFCRECLGLYADKSKPELIDQISCSTRDEHVHQVISCPVCRASMSLCRGSVAGLPLNSQLAEIVERFALDVKVEDNTPCCSLCEEDNKAKAVKFCTICGVLYCQDCLASLHPMRGPLKRHRLISADEYVSQTTSQGQINRDDQSSQQQSCNRHGLPISMYCVPCRVLICTGCLTDHPEHAVRDISSAVQKDKPAVLSKTNELEKILQQTNESLSGFMRLDKRIQENQDLHNKEVEKAYNAALKDLDAWKLSSLDHIKARYSQWSVQCSTIIKQLRFQAEEMEMMVQASTDLLSSKDVAFLQGSTDFTKAIDDQLAENTAALKKHEVNRQKLLDSVQRDFVVPRRVTVKETAQECHDLKAGVDEQLASLRVTKPDLSLTETSEEYLRITDEGSVVKAEGLSRGWWGCGAVTDGRFRADRYYWELQITCSPGCDCYCYVGVVKESSGLKEDVNLGSDSWCIEMAYSDSMVCCYNDCDGEIKPDCQQRRPHTGPQHLGLYLDCDQRSLTVLDCGHNQVIATVRGVEVTEPLVPWVRFSMYRGQSVSARLVTGDSVTLPQILCDMLNIP